MKPIDLRKLAKNFNDEKSKEDLYWQRNDAKFRAVHQRCTNYDEFRQIVEAAHLRPLDRNETLTLERRPTAWNQPAAKDSSNDTILPSESTTQQPIKFFAPKNITEFIQQWRRMENEMRLNYLHQLDNLDQLFLMDIPTDFLHDLTVLYRSNHSSNDAELIVNILFHLTKSKRFELMKSFLTDQNRLELEQLFSRLSSFSYLRYPIFLLKNIYL